MLLTLGVHEATIPESKKNTNASIPDKDHSLRKSTKNITETNETGVKEPTVKIRKDVKEVEASIVTKNPDTEDRKINTKKD